MYFRNNLTNFVILNLNFVVSINETTNFSNLSWLNMELEEWGIKKRNVALYIRNLFYILPLSHGIISAHVLVKRGLK